MDHLRLLLACIALAGWIPGRAVAGTGTAQGRAISEDAVQAQLLDGVRAFRAGRYDDALRIFRSIEAGSQRPEMGLYMGMTLHKLGRHLEALSAFREARRAGLSESVATYYQAVSCFRLGMLMRAQRDLTWLLMRRPHEEDQIGPRLKEGARRFLAAVEEALGRSSPPQLLLAAITEAEAAALRGQGGLEWIEEAVEISAAAAPTKDQRERMQHLIGQSRDGEASALLRRIDAAPEQR